MANIQVAEVEKVSDMDVSQGLVGKYCIVNQVQKINCGSQHTSLTQCIGDIALLAMSTSP